MTKNNGFRHHQREEEEDDDGLLMKDMDGVIIEDSPFQSPGEFCEDDVGMDMNQEAQEGGGDGHHDDQRGGGGGGGEIYHLLDDVNDASSMFYNDFPPLPDFPCMSSSSSSSSAPHVTVTKPVASTSSSSSASSSSATSWTASSFQPPQTEEYYNNSEERLRYQHDHIHRQHQQYGGDQAAAVAAAAALSSTASMEISLPLPDDTKNTNNGEPDAEDCMNVMENFGYMDLLDGSDIWDPSSIFENENPQQQHNDEGSGGGFFQDNRQQGGGGGGDSQILQPNHHGNEQQQQQQQQQAPFQEDEEGENDGLYFLQGNTELAVIFFDWLKQNKDYISAQDMRSIKLKRSTIDSALKRLGTNKEGKKQLLKLILEWVEQHQLQKKVRSTAAVAESPYDHYPPPPPDQQTMNPNPNADLNCNPDPNTCFSPPTTWAPAPPPPPCVQESGSIMATAFPPPTMGGGGGYGGCDIPNYSSAPNPNVNGNFYQQTAADQYQASPMETTQSWNIAPGQFAMAPPHPSQYNQFQDTAPRVHPAQAPMYVNAYPYPVFDHNTGERLVRLGASATKEARKKRMARQRRISINHPFRHGHHHHHHHNHNNNNHQQNQQPQDVPTSEHQVHAAAAVAGGGGGVEECTPAQVNPTGNWIYWSPAPAAPPPPPAPAPAPAPTTVTLVQPVVEPSCHTAAPVQIQPAVDRGTMQPMNHQQQQRPQFSADRKQGLKTEKNLKFLLQKVLKQSDVGNLGRIVLPKKEAETHLPELESRDGISIAMEDIGTSNVWNMRYRFWPNNKSRMYLLENTGDFVKVNGLQEGDFIVIYSDTKCGKYLIRGVKVRQPGSKPEAKKPAKKHQRGTSNFSPSSFRHSGK